MMTTFVSLEEITKFLPDTVVVVDEDTNIVATNDQITTLLGYKPQDVIGQKLNMLLPHRYRATHDQHFKEYLKQPSVRRMGAGLNLTGLRKNGTEVDVDVALAPVEAKERKLVIATIRDVTDIKELERSLLKKNKKLQDINHELEKFGYMIAHDLKSPLINIHALLHLMTKELPSEKSHKLQEYITAMQNSLELMTNLIAGVTAYTNAGTGSKKEEMIDLNKVVADVRKLIHIPANGRIDVEGELPYISGNITKVMQVFVNLVNNAFKHNDSDAPRVLIQAKTEADCCYITISDNGPGVPVEHRKNIFRLFDKGTSKRRDSQGIGLSIVKKIVEERGGSVKVDAGPLGGASFVINWPGATNQS